MSNPDSFPTRRAFIPKASCPMALAADALGDRWTLLILREAFYGVTRFADMQADLSIPRSVLTDRLTKLVAQGLLERRPYQEKGHRTRQAYTLTQVGKDFAPVLIALMEWGETHILRGPAPIEIRQITTEEPLRLSLVTQDGQTIATKDATFTKRTEA